MLEDCLEEGEYSCGELYNCCDCGENECGCEYCFSCNACENCLKD